MRRLTLLSTLMLGASAVASAEAAPPASAPVAASAATLARLMEADTNRDGQVSRPELIAWRAASFARFDRNGDGSLSLDDIPSFLRGAPIGSQMADLIRQYDANADGRLARAEFVTGPTPLFDLADANHDGLATKAEVDAAAARLRAIGKP